MLGPLAHLVPVVWHSVALYLLLVLGMSLLGRRETTDLGPIELVIVMLIGSAVETGLVAGDTSLGAGLASAATLLVCNRLFALSLRRWPRLRYAFAGRPVPLVHNGQFLRGEMDAVGLSEDDVCQGMRERGYDDVSAVRLAVLEMDGTISVVPRPQPPKSATK